MTLPKAIALRTPIWFRDVVERWLPDDIERRGEEQQERARLIVGTCLAIAALTAPLVPIAALAYHGWNITSASALMVIVAMLLGVLLVHRTGRVQLAGALVPAFLFLDLVYVGTQRGGLGAINLICYPALPLVAGFLVGKRGAWAAAGAVTVAMGMFLGLERVGFEFPQGYNPEQRALLAAVGTSLMAALVAGIA